MGKLHSYHLYLTSSYNRITHIHFGGNFMKRKLNIYIFKVGVLLPPGKSVHVTDEGQTVLMVETVHGVSGPVDAVGVKRLPALVLKKQTKFFVKICESSQKIHSYSSLVCFELQLLKMNFFYHGLYLLL